MKSRVHGTTTNLVTSSMRVCMSISVVISGSTDLTTTDGTLSNGMNSLSD